MKFLATLLLAAASLLAADKPNLTGEWKLNIDKSSFGPMPPPNSQVMKIEHNEPSVATSSTQETADGQQMVISLKYTTDGKESVNDFRGAPAKVIAKWEGEALVVTTKMDFQGMDITVVNTIKKSADDKTLTAVAKINTPQGEFETTSVMDRVQK